VHRSRLSLLLIVLPLTAAACGRRDALITAEPEWRAAETVTPVRQAGPPSGEQALPPANNGVLAPGAADKLVPNGAPPLVKLIDAGAAPRSDLGYALTKGATQKVAMAMDMAMGMKAQGQTLPAQSVPRLTLTLESTVADRNAAGEARTDFRVTGGAVEPSGATQEEMARVLLPHLQSMKGAGIVYWMSPRGRVHDTKVDLPAGMSAVAQQLLGGMSQSLESMPTPLPSEPVGVGARWQVISRVASSGLDLLQSSVYTLKSREGGRARIEDTLVQLSASDTVHTPQMPAGMVAKVKAFSSTGQGNAQIDVKSAVPESRTQALKTALTLAVAGGGAGAGDESTVDTTATVQFSRP
jgi:hypothetical protein